MDWFMIAVGVLCILPFAWSAYNGALDSPMKTAILLGFAVLIVMGPAIYNSVALNIYLQGGGEFDGGEGEYSGEEYDPTEPEAWSQSGNIALFVCNVIPLVICVGIWQLGRAKQTKLEVPISG